jgi:hypothetical protein
MRRLRRGLTQLGVVLSTAVLMAACSPGRAPAPSGSASSSLPTCPPATVVNAALGERNTGPVLSGTPRSKICTYMAGPVSTRISISTGTPAEFETGERYIAKGIAVVDVAGLGDKAYASPGVGSLWVLKGSTQIEIIAPGTTLAKDEDIARDLLP